MRVLSIVGNRPQFIKAAPVAIALRRAGIEEVVLHTGQHYDDELSTVFFEELGLAEPDYRLESGSASHARQVALMLPGIEDAILESQPACVLVFGDTNSTLAGALAAAKVPVAVAHVESGLRSFDRAMPEELNRIVVDQLSELLLCPSELARANLEREGITDGVHVVGDVMLDASLLLAPAAAEHAGIAETLGLVPGRYGLLTLHRQANVQPDALARIVAAVNALDLPLVFPAHPRTSHALGAHGVAFGEHVTSVPPLGYLDFTALLHGAQVVITDSGGLQKEAYWHRIPCVTLRPSTEWPETVEAGWNRLCAPEPAALAAAVDATGKPPEAHPPLYGDGNSAEAIAALIATIGGP